MSLLWLLGVICCINLIECLPQTNKSINLQSTPFYNTSKLGDSPTFPVRKYEYNNYFYFGAILKGNPEELSLFCSYHNMRLASIENSGETKFLIDSLTQFKKQNLVFWTSGRKRNGVWFWDSEGAPIHYTSWAPNEPRTVAGTNCLQALFNYTDSSIRWSVNICEVANYFICKSNY